MAKKKESEFVQVAKKSLERKNQDFSEWRQRMLSIKKMEILEGKNSEWEESVIEEACKQIAIEELLKIL